MGKKGRVRGPKMADVGTIQSKPPSGEFQDVAKKFIAETADKDYRGDTGRTPSGTSIPGIKRIIKRKLLTTTQGGDGSGHGFRSAIGGGTEHILDLNQFMRKGAKFKMQNLKPMARYREQMAANIVDLPTEKNNKPDLGSNIHAKPGSFKGQKPGSTKDKMNIAPKAMNIDGGANHE